MYCAYIRKHYGSSESVSVVFDGYNNTSIKDAERSRRYTKMAPDIMFQENTPLTTTKDLFLANSKNKTQFIELLQDY